MCFRLRWIKERPWRVTAEDIRLCLLWLQATANGLYHAAAGGYSLLSPEMERSMDNDDGGNTIFCGEIFSDAITEKMRKIMELYEIRCGDLGSGRQKRE